MEEKELGADRGWKRKNLVLTEGGRERTFTNYLRADRSWKRKNVHRTTFVPIDSMRSIRLSADGVSCLGRVDVSRPER